MGPDEHHIDEVEPDGTVQAGGYVLRLGGAGTVLQHSAGTSAGETATLARALEEPEPKREDGAEALAAEVEEASEVTANVEKAASICKGISEGRFFAPEQLALEAGTLLDCLERLDKRKKHKKALRLARALATLLMLLKRWSDLLRTLRIALRAGEALGDLEAVAWAKHELGTLRTVAGDLEGADRDLREARAIRERIDDRRGLAATERNLGALCERLRQMVRDEELVRRGAGRRPSPLRVLSLAVVFALLFGAGGFGAGYVAGDSGDVQNPVAEEGPRQDDGTRPPGGDGRNGVEDDERDGVRDDERDGENPPGGEEGTDTYLLLVTLAGKGGGTVTGGGLKCGESACESKVPAGEEVTLAGAAAEGSTFEGFSEGPCEGAGPCTLTVDSPISLTATFKPIPQIPDPDASLVKPGKDEPPQKDGGGEGGEDSTEEEPEVPPEEVVE